MSSRARASGGLAIFLLVSSIVPAAAQSTCRCCELITATNDIECGASSTFLTALAQHSPPAASYAYTDESGMANHGKRVCGSCGFFGTAQQCTAILPTGNSVPCAAQPCTVRISSNYDVTGMAHASCNASPPPPQTSGQHDLACNSQAGQPPSAADPATQPACAHKSVTPRTGDLVMVDSYVAHLNCPSYACVDPPNVCNACVENWHCITCPADAGSGGSGSVDLPPSPLPSPPPPPPPPLMAKAGETIEEVTADVVTFDLVGQSAQAHSRPLRGECARFLPFLCHAPRHLVTWCIGCLRRPR
jgi:hypothetical protein